MKRSALVSVVLALGVGACSGAGGGSSSSGGASSSSSGGGGNVTLRDVFLALFVAQCAQEDRCATELGRTFTSRTACEAYWPSIIDYYMAFFGAVYEVGDGSKLQACTDALYPSSGSCTEAGEFPAPCRALLRVKNAVAAGGACGNEEGSPQCDLEFTCVTGATGCGTCRAASAVGASCSDMQPCVSGAYCNAGTCARLPGRGESCATAHACRGNLDCDGPSGAETCRERVGLGASCEEASCYFDLTCDYSAMPRTCRAQSAVGTSCARTDAARCHGTLCVFPSADAAMGTCQYQYTATPGQPCLGVGSYSYCTEGYADPTGDPAAPTGCTCRAYKGTGESCTYGQCATSCDNIDWTTTPPGPGTCAAPRANGATCSSDSECTSGHCSNGGTCAAPPMCN